MIGFLVIFALCFLPFFLKKVPQKQTPAEPVPEGGEESFVSGPDEPLDYFTVEDKPGIRLRYSQEKLPVLEDDMISSESVILYDSTDGVVLYSKNAQTPLYPASTTKIITACAALEHLSPDTVLSVGSELDLLQPESSLAYLHRDSELTLEDALYALLLPSGNDAAYTIAVNTARTVSGNAAMPDAEAVKYFSELMNEVAYQAGADHTHFCVPDGYHDPFHFTTAEDMLKISLYSEKYPLIAEISAQPYRETTVITGQSYYWENGNCLVTPGNQYYLDFAKGLKTGFTDEAGYCMVATASADGHELTAVILNAPALSVRYRDAARLFYAVTDPQKLLEPPLTTQAVTEAPPVTEQQEIQ